MRHNKKFNHLSRTSSHRKAMLSNMAASLILHKRITTTVAKAKALRVYVEPMITRSKTDSTHSRRMVFRQLQNKFAVTELFREVSVKVADRPGGYTRIIKLGNRLGDNAEMCMIELVDYNENLLGAKAPKKAKSTRRRGSSKKASEATAKVETPVEQKTEKKAAEPVAEKPVEEKVESTPVDEKAETKENPTAELEDEKDDSKDKA
jgi:large subunit ribosomal protein L17